MPYFRKRRYPNRRRRKRRAPAWYNKKYSVGDMASYAARGFRYLKSIVNVEYKSHDVSTSITTSGTVINFHSIGSGAGDGQRTGNSIKAKSLLIRGQIIGNATADSMFARIIIFMDTQQIADTQPSQTDVLDQDVADQLLAPLSNTTAGRFKIFMNKQIAINNKITAIPVAMTFKYFKRMGHHIRYNGTATSDIQKGGIYLLFIHSGGVNTPTFDLTGRLRYVDN